MDQVMGDLQVQFNKIRRMWEEEREQQQRTEQEGKASAIGRETPAASPEGGPVKLHQRMVRKLSFFRAKI
jgi:hypothetical protein